LGRSVYGTVQSITDLTVEAMRDYLRRRYSPRNVVLVGSGQIDFDGLVSAAQECCGRWEPLEAGRDRGPASPADGFLVIQKETATQQYAVQMAAGPKADDADRYAANLLAMILGDDTGSRLYWELIDPGLAEHASLGLWEYDDAGLFMTYLACQPEQAADNLKHILDLYRQAESEGVSDEELAQAKSKVGSRIVLAGERPRNRLFAVGAEWVMRRRYLSVRDVLEAVAAVTPDEVSRVLSRFPLSRSTTVAIGPLKDLPAPQ
jgi:predicted Zn-dependent peptidase